MSLSKAGELGAIIRGLQDAIRVNEDGTKVDISADILIRQLDRCLRLANEIEND